MLYNVGIYTRLSVDDANNTAKTRGKHYIPSDSSESTQNQRELLSKFVMLNGWIETKVYCDDGYSGANMNRPAFTRMMEDVKNGVINLVLVRDLSRLGRDYIEVGRYTDYIFPTHGCRFVALLDGIDTAEDNTDMLHFRSLMNDYHLKELSGKVKSVLYAKAKQGQYLGAYAPYGYMKSDEDKHKLVVDEYSANVVRKMFEMRAQGVAYGKIVAHLNNEGILSPLAYWHSLHGKGECRYSNVWMYASVKKLLASEVYTGVLIQNHTGTLSYKNKKSVCKPKSEWIRHENHHEPIIDRRQWEKVQELAAERKKISEGRRTPAQSLFRAKLVCADCKTNFTSNTETHRRKNGSIKKYTSYFCARYAQSGMSVCTKHCIYEMSLIKVVLADIKHHAQAVTFDENAMLQTLKRKLLLSDNESLGDAKRELRKLKKRIAELENLAAGLYEDKVCGKISQETFDTLTERSESERTDKLQRLGVLSGELESRTSTEADISKWITAIGKHMNVETLDRTIIDELIHHIEVGDKQEVDGKRTQDIRIYYNFVGFIG